LAGIYIHIPFCKQFCYYCDFYKSANYKYVDPFMDAIIKEIDLQANFTDEIIDTIYFGGGTPSSVSIRHIELILKKLTEIFIISEAAEITFELNPDDVDCGYYLKLKNIGINRLSIGIQSFNDDVLKFLNRRHNAKQAINSIKDAQFSGFTNISIDLIYGIPKQEINDFKKDLKKFFDLDIKHLSAYHLGIEPRTQFGRMLKTGSLTEVSETDSLLFYKDLTKSLTDKGFEHYEISNFAKDGFYSKHNKSYWNNAIYIGFGPGAHSYNRNFRFWNVSSVKDYIQNINDGANWFEHEELNILAKYNEYILTGLRTQWGCNLEKIRDNFGIKYYKHCLRIINQFDENSIIRIKKKQFILNEAVLLQSDYYIGKFIF